jgi:hypothetical protein
MNHIYREEWHNSSGVYIDVMFSTAPAIFHFFGWWVGVGVGVGAKSLHLGFAEAPGE